MTDATLNNFPGLLDIAEVADSQEFHGICERANRLFPYPIHSWAPPLAREALSHTRLAQLYLDRQANAATARLRSGILPIRLVPDVHGTIQCFWNELADDYRPGTVVGGNLITWGYEAYLATRLTPMATTAIAQALRWSWVTDTIEEEGLKVAGEAREDRWEGTLGAALVKALDELFIDEDLKTAYFHLAYSEEPMREIAISMGLSYHLLHARLMTPLCFRIAQAAGRAMNDHVRFCGELRAALAEVLPMTEFTARYLSPAEHKPEFEEFPLERF